MSADIYLSASASPAGRCVAVVGINIIVSNGEQVVRRGAEITRGHKAGIVIRSHVTGINARAFLGRGVVDTHVGRFVDADGHTAKYMNGIDARQQLQSDSAPRRGIYLWGAREL